jgi:hypothetical protein
MLDSATNLIDPTKTDLQGDIMYNGSMVQWQKFANSLRLRVAIRIADRNSVLAGQQITKALAAAGGVFASNADNAIFSYSSVAPNYNPLYYDRFINGRQDFCASNTIVNVMNTLGDGRIGYYFDSVPGTGGAYIGRPFGQNGSDAGVTPNTAVSQPSGWNGGAGGLVGTTVAYPTLSPTAPTVLLDYAEVQFILAEAAARGIGGQSAGMAQGYYDAAIDASFIWWTGAAAPSAYHAQANVNYTTLTTGGGQTYKQAIGKQKWLALYMQGMQGWIEWRRLDFGIFNQPVDGFIPPATSLPVRMLYPYDEGQLDATGYNQAISDQGPDLQSTKVWWDMY